MATRNPYRPGAGLYPPYLAGREHAVRALSRAQGSIEGGEGANPLVVTGLRGMGKTSVLLNFRERLGQAGWLVPSIQEFDTQRPLAVAWPRLRTELERIAPKSLPRRRRSRLQADELTWTAGGEVGTGGARVKAAATGALRRRADDRRAAGEELRAEIGEFVLRVLDQAPLALLFDEAQDASLPDLGLLAELGHRASQESWRLLIVFAGLTPLHDRLVRARSYATRFPAVPVAALDEGAAAAALEVPARELGVEWTSEAVEQANAFAGGVPYFIQMIGEHVWEKRNGDFIEVDVVLDAVPDAKGEIEHAMYRPLWNRASEAEQEYLVAMALTQRTHLGIPVADVLNSLGRRHSTGATIRARLVSKGLIHGMRYGHLEFSYPGFREFLLEQVERRG